VKTPEQVVADIQRRLERTWHEQITGSAPAWPHRFPLGTPAKKQLETGWQSTYQPLIRTWRDWADTHQVTVSFEAKRVYITLQDIPTHLEIDSIDSAAHLVGGPWPARVSRARGHLDAVAARFPNLDPSSVPGLIRSLDRYTDVDFTLALTVAQWFTSNDATGLTPRQVPVPGVHAKFLNTHQPEILTLTSRNTLGLLPAHPPRIHFTYLDPVYRRSGARLHDSATVGDRYTPPYRPDVLIISENKDTAIHFPEVPGGISIEGAGFGGKTAAAFEWITRCDRIVYWGDIDADGYEVLNGWRSDGIAAASMLMDVDTYDRYEPYGTNLDRKGIPLKPGTPKGLPHLTTEERAVYGRVLSAELRTHRRIEQERIPLSEAAQALEILLGSVNALCAVSAAESVVSGSVLRSSARSTQ
jgi:hypothetical protein